MSVQHVTQAGFEAAVGQGVALVDFWADWCGPCRMLAPVIEELGERYEGRAVVAKVDVDAEPELARRFGVMSIPTVVILENGREVERKVGVMPGAVYAAALDARL